MDFGPTGKMGDKRPKNGRKLGKEWVRNGIFTHFSAIFLPFSRRGQNPFFGHFLRPEKWGLHQAIKIATLYSHASWPHPIQAEEHHKPGHPLSGRDPPPLPAPLWEGGRGKGSRLQRGPGSWCSQAVSSFRTVSNATLADATLVF